MEDSASKPEPPRPRVKVTYRDGKVVWPLTGTVVFEDEEYIHVQPDPGQGPMNASVIELSKKRTVERIERLGVRA